MKYQNSIHVYMSSDGKQILVRWDHHDRHAGCTNFHPIEQLNLASKSLKDANAKDKGVTSLVYTYTYKSNDD